MAVSTCGSGTRIITPAAIPKATAMARIVAGPPIVATRPAASGGPMIVATT